MKRIALAMVLALAVVFSVIGSASAITNGVPDGNNHPYVGLAVFDVINDEGEQVPSHRCSASLLTPTIVLTAGHCTDGTAAARVWFDADVQSNAEYPFSGATSYDGIAYTHPDFCIGCGNGLPGFASTDVGIIILSEPVPTSVVSAYAALPSLEQVDTLENKTPIDFVGYGVQEQVKTQPGQSPRARWTGPRIRMYAPSELVSGNFKHSDEFMKLALNPGGGSGGTCFGDSGGPDLLGGTNVVLAVNSYVTNVNCSGVGYSARVDTESVLSWVNDFLDGTLPE
jgi:secreted trypsin-like serine protease